MAMIKLISVLHFGFVLSLIKGQIADIRIDGAYVNRGYGSIVLGATREEFESILAQENRRGNTNV